MEAIHPYGLKRFAPDVVATICDQAYAAVAANLTIEGAVLHLVPVAVSARRLHLHEARRRCRQLAPQDPLWQDALMLLDSQGVASLFRDFR